MSRILVQEQDSKSRILVKTNLVSIEDKLGDDASQATEHMSAPVNYNCLRRKSRHF